MSEQTDKIILQESNLAGPTKREYVFRVGQFYSFTPIYNDDDLTDCPSDELQQMLLKYVRFLVKRVKYVLESWWGIDRIQRK